MDPLERLLKKRLGKRSLKLQSLILISGLGAADSQHNPGIGLIDLRKNLGRAGGKQAHLSALVKRGPSRVGLHLQGSWGCRPGSTLVGLLAGLSSPLDFLRDMNIHEAQPLTLRAAYPICANTVNSFQALNSTLTLFCPLIFFLLKVTRLIKGSECLNNLWMGT